MGSVKIVVPATGCTFCWHEGSVLQEGCPQLMIGWQLKIELKTLDTVATLGTYFVVPFVHPRSAFCSSSSPELQDLNLGVVTRSARAHPQYKNGDCCVCGACSFHSFC